MRNPPHQPEDHLSAIPRTTAFVLAALVWLASVFHTGDTAAQALRIGLAAPLSGPLALLGEQMRSGAQAAARGFPDADIALIVEDDQCTAEGGEAAARQFVRTGVRLATGFLCIEAIEAALPILSEAGIVTVTTGVRANALTDRRARAGHLVYRMAPRADDEAEAVSRLLTRRWRAELFAIVDDGTLYGRELAETFRLAAETTGMSPVFVDSFRPQFDNQIGLVGRLRRAGATHAFAGGDRDDIAIIARDAAGLDYELILAGGEALRSAGEQPLPEGVLMVGLPDWQDIADWERVDALRAAGVEPEGYVLPGFAGVEIAAAAVLAATRLETDIAAVLDEQTFATVLGPLRFDANGDLEGSFYRLFRFDGLRFAEVE